MKIAFVSRGDPLGQNGAGVRMSLTIDALSRLGEVSVTSLVSDARPPGRIGQTVVRYVPLVQRRSRLADHLFAALGLRPRKHAVWCPHAQSELIGDLSDFDLIWAYGERAGLAVQAGCWVPPLIVDFVDYEGDRDARQQFARSSSTRLARGLFALLERVALRRSLRRLADRASASVISTEIDRLKAGLPSTTVLANSYVPTVDSFPRSDSPANPTFLFVGFLGYGPNRDAFEWLLLEIWPLLRHTYPSSILRIVGRGLEAQAVRSAPAGVEICEQVTSMDDILRETDIALVPLKNGSGSRVKILEAWASGIPVISTSIGAEGLPYMDRSNLMLAETPTAFQRCALELTESADLYSRLSANGLRTFHDQCSPEEFAMKVRRTVETVRTKTVQRERSS